MIEAANEIMLSDCLNTYVDAMQMSMATVINESEFMNIHQRTKNAAISQVCKTFQFMY